MISRFWVIFFAFFCLFVFFFFTWHGERDVRLVLAAQLAVRKHDAAIGVARSAQEIGSRGRADRGQDALRLLLHPVRWKILGGKN